MLNPTIVARHIAYKLGLTHANVEVPLKILLNHVRNVSINTFSLYYPLIHIHYVDSDDSEQNPKKNGTYYIDLSQLPGDIINIAKTIKEGGSHDVYNQLLEPYDSDMIPMVSGADLLNAKMLANFASYTNIPLTSKFIHPNTIIIRQGRASFDMNVAFKLLLRHSRNFYTIGEAYNDEFLELVEYDAKLLIFNIRKHYKTIGSVFGSIDMNIDDFDVSGLRKDLTDKWMKESWKAPERDRFRIA